MLYVVVMCFFDVCVMMKCVMKFVCVDDVDVVCVVLCYFE